MLTPADKQDPALFGLLLLASSAPGLSPFPASAPATHSLIMPVPFYLPDSLRHPIRFFANALPRPPSLPPAASASAFSMVIRVVDISRAHNVFELLPMNDGGHESGDLSVCALDLA